MFGLRILESGDHGLAVVTLLGSLLVKNVISVFPDASPSLDPSDPALHADTDSAPAISAATVATCRRLEV